MQLFIRTFWFRLSSFGLYSSSKHLKNQEIHNIYIYIYQNELDKAYFQCYLAYGGFKDLTRRTASDKILHHQAFNIAKNPKYDRYQRSLARMFYKFFDKKPLVAVLQMRIL